MTTPVLICDDSGMARKQMLRSLPSDWDIEVSFATNGVECLAAIAEGKADILFLDLNMPELDGYGVLEVVCRKDLPTMVIVVSGDIQPEARARVLKLGAIDFIKKPTSPELVAQLLHDYGIHAMPSTAPESRQASHQPAAPAAPGGLTGMIRGSGPSRGHLPQIEAPTFLDCLQEISNIAMGRAGDLLARLLNVFVKLPIPRVNLMEASELQMTLAIAGEDKAYSAVCQGFIGAGLAGEALMIFSDSSFTDMAKLLRYPEAEDKAMEVEMLMDLSSVLVGAFLKGLSDQLDIRFGMGHPTVFGQHLQVADLLDQNASRWRRMLSIEINYEIEGYDVNCDLLLLFTEDAVPSLEEKLRYLTE